MQVIEENIMNNVMWIKKDRSYKKHIDIYSIVALIFVNIEFHDFLLLFYNKSLRFTPKSTDIPDVFLLHRMI